MVACRDAAALSGRLRARAMAGAAATDDSNVKVGFIKKSGEPPLIVPSGASQEKYLLDHAEELGLRVLDMQREKPFIRAKILEWEAEDRAMQEQNPSEETQERARIGESKGEEAASIWYLFPM
jgi:hypothetical protein